MELQDSTLNANIAASALSTTIASEENIFLISSVKNQSLNIDEQVPPLNISSMSVMDIEAADSEIFRAVDLFLNCCYDEAEGILLVNSKCDALSALGTGLFAALRAAASSAKEDVDTACALLQRSISLAEIQHSLCLGEESSNGVVSLMRRIVIGPLSTLASLTGLGAPSQILNPAQFRSIVVRAEATLIESFVQLLGESISGLFRAGMGLRRAHRGLENAWREYQTVCNQFTPAEVEQMIDRHTLSGILFGYGSLCVTLSLIPPKISKFFSLLGYKGDCKKGFELLEKCKSLNSARSPLASLYIGGYNSSLLSYAPTVLAPTMAKIAADNIDILRFNNSPIHLFLLSRVFRSIRETDISSKLLQRAHSVPSQSNEFKCLCDYELGLNSMIELDFKTAAKSFSMLRKNGYWLKSYFSYAEAACLEMLGEHESAITLFNSAPGYVTRKYAGRTLGLEQYVVKKVEQFQFSEDYSTYLPALELLYMWNAFAAMKLHNLEKIREILCNEIEKMQLTPHGSRSSISLGIPKDLNNLNQSKSIPSLRKTQLNRSSNSLMKENNGILIVLYAILASVEMQLKNYIESARLLSLVTDPQIPKLGEDKSWVVPYSFYQRGELDLLTSKNIVDGAQQASLSFKAASKCSEFCFEFRLAFRIQSANIQVEPWAANQNINNVETFPNPEECLRCPNLNEIFPKDHAIWGVLKA